MITTLTTNQTYVLKNFRLKGKPLGGHEKEHERLKTIKNLLIGDDYDQKLTKFNKFNKFNN